MSDSRFSPGQSGGDDRFGYFGAAAPPASPGASQFGGTTTAPGVGAPNPFGSVPGPFGGAPGAQVALQPGMPGYGPPPSSSSGSKAKPVALVLVALAVLGVAWFGYHAYLRSRPVELPSTVAGLPLTSEPTVQNAVDAAQQQLQQENPGMQLQVKAYSTDATRIVIAAAGRGRTNVADDMAAFGNDIGGTTKVGADSCASSAASHITVCERTDGDLTVMVAEVARADVPTETEVAAMVDDIWRQL